MTITTIAKQLNTTPMTIYRKLKRAGVDVSTLRDGSTGEVTAHGAGIIASLFAESSATPTTTGATDGATNVQRVTERDITGGVVADMMAAEVLRAKLDAANDTIARLEAERDRLLEQLAAANDALAREQTDRQQERLALTTSSSTGGQQRRGLFWWLKNR